MVVLGNLVLEFVGVSMGGLVYWMLEYFYFKIVDVVLVNDNIYVEFCVLVYGVV